MGRLKLAAFAALLTSSAAAQQCGTITTCPPVSTPLAGSELLYVVQASVSKKMTVNQLAADIGPLVPLSIGAPIAGGSAPNILVQLTNGLQDGSLGAHLSLSGLGALSTDATGTGVLATKGDIPTSLPPNGAAGGDLTGSYPNPTIAANAVTNAKAAQMAAMTLKGNSGGSTANAADLNSANVQNIVDITECINFLAQNIGGVGDGSTDNSAAWTAAFSALGANGGCIYFPPGKYYSSAAKTLTYPSTSKYSVTIVGSGADVSTLYWSGTNGLTIDAVLATQSVHIRDLTFSTGAAGTYTALNLNNSTLLGVLAQSDIFRVTFRGDDGGAATDYWSFAIGNVGWSNFNYDTIYIYGSSSGSGGGINIAGNASVSPFYNIVHNIAKSGFYNLGIGFQYGNYVQGVTISQSNFVGGTTCIYQPASQTGATQLALIENNFNCGANQVYLLSPIAVVIALGNLFYVPANQNGVYDGSSGNLASFIGNEFSGVSATGSVGIDEAGAFTGGTIESNGFSTLANGIMLGASATTWTVADNTLQTVTTPIANSGASNKIHDNAGYNPVGVTAAANVGASPATITAGPSPETHYIKQSATFNATVAKGGQTICGDTVAAVPCVVQLGPNESYVVTWTTTQPTYVKDVH